MQFLSLLHRVCDRENLTANQAETAMHAILQGEPSTAQVAAFLVALRMKGETAEELVGFARAMRARSVRVDAPANGVPLIDTCGTGGDNCSTFNISTVVAFVVAAAGVRVAKHGNRSISSRCGSADVLEALGATVALAPERIAACIREVGIGFLFAPALHPAMKHAQPARLELKMRTAFNLLGPLTNPAGADAQIVGAPSPQAAALIAEALATLGLRRGFVVHGLDGLDEITITGETLVFEILHGAIDQRIVTPEDFGVEAARVGALAGGDREANAAIARAILAGVNGPHRDIVLVNSAAALVAAGAAANFRAGAALAAAAIDSGAAARKLDDLIAFTRSAATHSAVHQ